MADDPKLPLKPQAAEPLPRPKPPVVEREPLTSTVIEPTPAEVAVPQRVKVEAPPAWRSSSLGMLFPLLLIAAVLLFILYRLQFSPLIQRWEHGVERRVFGERDYEAHRDPHSRFDQVPRVHEDEAHRH